MGDRAEYRDLGMDRRIPRRDFLNGLAIAVTGGSLRAAGAEVSASARGAQQASAPTRSGSTVGGYNGVTTPDEPIIVHITSNPNKPGLPRKEQNRAGAEQLLTTTFEQFELEIRRHLTRMLGPAGFDPAADIVGLTVNRWPQGLT